MLLHVAVLVVHVKVAYSKLKDGGFTECEQFMAQEGSADPRLDMLIQWSLQSLKEEVQDMFYDAATVLLGELETTVIMLWQARWGCSPDMRHQGASIRAPFALEQQSHRLFTLLVGYFCML
jgi:hypothetical protein